MFDLAVRYCGSADAAFMIANHNDLSVTSTLLAGTEVTIPEMKRKDIVSYFNNRNIQPATAWNVQSAETGISHWAINIDFEVTEEYE